MYQYLQKLSVGKIPNGFAKVKVLVSQSGLTLRAQGLCPSLTPFIFFHPVYLLSIYSVPALF